MGKNRKNIDKNREKKDKKSKTIKENVNNVNMQKKGSRKKIVKK